MSSQYALRPEDRGSSPGTARFSMATVQFSVLGAEQLGGELRRTVDSWSPDGGIGLESAAGLVSGLEVLRLEGIRWVGPDFGGLSGPPSHGIL